MSALTTAPCPATLYVLLKDDDIYNKIDGLASYSAEDVDYYDRSTHSLIVDANMLGNAHLQLTQDTAAQTMPTPAIATASPAIAGGIGLVVASTHSIGAFMGPSAIDDTGVAVEPLVLNGAITTIETADEAFKVGASDLVPAPTKKTATIIKWWSGAAASGNVVAWSWAHLLRFVGPNPPERL